MPIGIPLVSLAPGRGWVLFDMAWVPSEGPHIPLHTGRYYNALNFMHFHTFDGHLNI